MIHRFVDLLEEVELLPWSTIWNIRRVTDGTDRFFALDTRGVSTLAVYLDNMSSTFAAPSINLPELSPDLLEYAYIVVPAAGNRGQVRKGDSYDLAATTLLAENPSGGVAGPPSGGTQLFGWSPDSAHVYYRGIDNNTDRDGEIWRVDRDGTNDTLVYTNATLDGVAWGQLPRISPDGTQLAWWIDQDAPTAQGLWVMDVDGTNDTRIYTMVGAGDFYGWSRDSEWLLFTDNNFGANWWRMFKIHPDGTGQTTIWDTTFTGTRPNLTFGQNSVWVPGATGILCSLDDGTGDIEVGVLSADGSETFTAFSPQRLITASTPANFGPIYSDGRAFWLEGSGAADTSFVVSTLVDGTGYRIDDDMTDDTTTPDHDDMVFNGFHLRIA